MWIRIFTVIIAIAFASQSMIGQHEAFVRDMHDMLKKELRSDEPGGSFLVVKDGNVVFEASYGVADMQTGLPISSTTVFNTGSISKTFVANAILILQERGELSIEDPLSMYFDDFDNKDIASSVRIKHLLSHSSGLPDLRDVRNNVEFYMTARDTANFEPIKRARNLNFEPGSDFEYSNPAYNGLALIIEKVSGQKWQTFIKENIFDPAGMESSTITEGSHPESGVAHAYNKRRDEFVESDYGEFPTFTAAGNGGVWSTVIDLEKYERALQSERLFSKATLEQSRTVYHPDNWAGSPDPFLGWGWFIDMPSDELQVKIVKHTGSQGGFRAFFVTIPEQRVTYICLCNQPVPTGSFLDQGLDLMMEHGLLE